MAPTRPCGRAWGVLAAFRVHLLSAATPRHQRALTGLVAGKKKPPPERGRPLIGSRFEFFSSLAL